MHRFVIALLLVACERDECRGPARCVDNVAINCVDVADGEIGSHRERQDTDCLASYCHTPPAGTAGEAFCSLFAEPDPRAPTNAAEIATVTGCRDGRFVEWRYGYRVAQDECGEHHVCVDDLDAPCRDEAFCAIADEPDPRCAPGIGSTCVDDETLLYCRCGYAQSESTCAAAAPHCVLEATADLPEQGVCRPSP